MDDSLSDYFLELPDSEEQGLGGRRATRNIDIDRNFMVNSLEDMIRGVRSTADSTSTHGDDPFRARHLLVDLFNERNIFFGNRSRYNHKIGLRWVDRVVLKTYLNSIVRCFKSRCIFQGTASRGHGERPERASLTPTPDFFKKTTCFFLS